MAITEIDSDISEQIKQQNRPPIPITEISLKNKSVVSIDEQQQDKIESAGGNKQTAD